MKKVFLNAVGLFLLCSSLLSCSQKAIQLNDGEIVHCQTISQIGDSVQVLRRNWGKWEIEENVYKLEDTLYTIHATDSLPEKINQVTIEKKKGVVIILPYSLF